MSEQNRLFASVPQTQFMDFQSSRAGKSRLRNLAEQATLRQQKRAGQNKNLLAIAKRFFVSISRSNRCGLFLSRPGLIPDLDDAEWFV